MCVWYVSVWMYVLCVCGMSVCTWQIMHMWVTGHPWVPVLLFYVDWKGVQQLQRYLVLKLKETLLPLHPSLLQEYWDCRFALVSPRLRVWSDSKLKPSRSCPKCCVHQPSSPALTISFVFPHLVEPRESKNCMDVHRHFYPF